MPEYTDGLSQLFDTIYPVGSVIITANPTNPGVLFKHGTWVAAAVGRCIVGIDPGQSEFDALKETGGAKTVTLSVAEMPSHTHVQNSHNHTQDAHNHAVTDPGHTHAYKSQTATTGVLTSYEHGAIDTSSNQANEGAAVDSNVTGISIQNAIATNQAATATNQNTGGGGAHNNLQPYVVYYIWERTA